MIAQVVCGIELGAQPVKAASGRAIVGEIEPNDDYVHAQVIPLNTTVKGAMEINNDNKDVFKVAIVASTVINISLVQKEWNPAMYSDYSANMELLGPGPLHSLIRRENGNWQIKTMSILCIETGDYYVWLYLGPNSKPVNYTMNINNQTPQVIGRVMDLPGFLDATQTLSGTNPNIWYRLSIPTTKGIQVTMFVPTDSDFDIFALDQWDMLNYYYPGHRNPLWLNASSDNNSAGNIEFLKAEGWAGQYWLRIKAWPGSKGTYKLRVSDYDPVDSDGDNTPDHARVITKKCVINNNLQMSFDHFDWYKVFLAKDNKINITMTLLTNTGDVYNISIYDQSMNYVTGGFDTVDGNAQNATNPVTSKVKIKNFTATASGNYYVMAMPVRDPNMIEQFTFRPLNSDYSISFDLPDKGPKNMLDIKAISFPEDTTYTALDLTGYFQDNEGDPLTYSFTPSYMPNITISIATNGTVTMKPIKNWNTGTQTLPITFRADDAWANTGKSFDTASTTLRVIPVDDPPYFVGTLPPIVMNESETMNMTGFLYDYFKDVDDSTLNFSVANNGSIPVHFDNTEGRLTVGPVDGWFGELTMNVTARDTTKTNLPAWANLTVTVMHKNHPPQLVGPAVRYLNISENQPTVTVLTAPFFLDKDVSYAHDHLRYSIASPQPANLLAITDINTGILKVGPLQNWHGQDIIWLLVRDNSTQEAKLKLIVNVAWVNQPPKITSVQPSLGNQTMLEGQNITFKVTHVTDPDTNQTMTYMWYVEGTIQSTTTDTFLFVSDNNPNSQMFHAGFYKVKVEASDGKLTDFFLWNLTVVDINLPPTNVKIVSPTEGKVFTEGQTINFNADLAVDIEGDPISYTWKNNITGVTLGTGQKLPYKDLKKGTYTITLIVEDGVNKVYKNVHIVVKAKAKQNTPSFEGILLVGAVCIALVLISRRRRK
jgi:hypothetical protein